MRCSYYFLTVLFLFFVESVFSQSLTLFDFEGRLPAEQAKGVDGSYKLVSEDGNTFLQVNNGFSKHESGVKLYAPKSKPWDLRGYYQVKADVKNTGDEFIQVEMFVGNDPDGLKRWYCSDYVDLFPGEEATIVVNLAWSPWIFQPQPEIVGMRGAPGILKTDISKIQEITFNSRYSTAENQFTVDNIHAKGLLEIRDTANFFPFVDQFGQYKHREWTGKANSENDLKSFAQKEQEDLKKQPEQRSRFGGWTGCEKQDSTGFFYPKKIEGKWWLVDPEGYLFWSNGVNCAAPNTGTGIEYREHYFENVPKQRAFKQFYGKSRWASHGFYKDHLPYETFDFYAANLYRIYGNDWHNKFMDLVHNRLRSWGMNTIGFMSDREAVEQKRTPYVGSIWIRNTQKIEGSSGFWGKFHDVFDPEFRSIVRKSVDAQKQGANDPWCIGYFIDNELSWGQLGSLSIGVLKSPATQSAKIEFINDLKKKYNSISQLNKSWKTSYYSWEQMLQTTNVPDLSNASDDLVAFYEKIADTYFKTIHDELKKVAPNNLYLGCRFAWANNAVVLKAGAKYLDIMSFNKYEYSIANVGLPEGIDKPILIGEYHFGATDRGHFHPGVKLAKTQEERGVQYQNYINGALDNPYIVGAHWFQYVDQPLTGRGDGENYNVGLINVCDVPYPEMVEKLRATNYNMYQHRLGDGKE